MTGELLRKCSMNIYSQVNKPVLRRPVESGRLLRQYFPKGTDLSRWTADEIEAVATALNSRPRKTLGWKTPAEALNEHLQSLLQAGVATTS